MSRSSNAFSGRALMTAAGTAVFAPQAHSGSMFPTPYDAPPTPPRTNSSDSSSPTAAPITAAPNAPSPSNTAAVTGGEREHLRRSIHMVRSYQRRSTPSASIRQGMRTPPPPAGTASGSASGQQAGGSSSAHSANVHRAAMIHAMMHQAARNATITGPRSAAVPPASVTTGNVSPSSTSTIAASSNSTFSPSSSSMSSPSSSGTRQPTAAQQFLGASSSGGFQIQHQQAPTTPARRRLFHPPPSATTPPSSSDIRFRPVTGSGTVNPSVHPQFRSKAVCKLFCRHCANVMCRRGMKAILLGNTKVELYSTDTPPTGVELVYGDYLTQNCSCRIRDAACLGCGNVVGYHVTQPCEKCLEACNNGHFYMFLSDGVQPVERIDASGSKLLRWASLPCAEQDRDETETSKCYEQLCR
ncbi:Protein fam72a [Geranomyces variabilis]|nr:Protein fam72a [Geranomyces variabilis]